MSDCTIVIERRDRVTSQQPSDVTIKFIVNFRARLRAPAGRTTFPNLPTRLAKTLLQLTEDQDGAGPKRKVTITQREISQIIGRSRESTNKQLRAWAKRGWIKLERGGVSVLAPEKIADVAAEGSELDAS
jgi:CRP-like cAMP-binding protein